MEKENRKEIKSPFNNFDNQIFKNPIFTWEFVKEFHQKNKRKKK